jgi:hypothetical protein
VRITPTNSQVPIIARNPYGSSALSTELTFRKIPDPIMDPTTIMTASNSPST